MPARSVFLGMKRRSGGGEFILPPLPALPARCARRPQSLGRAAPSPGPEGGSRRFSDWKSRGALLHGGAVRQVVDAGGRFPERAEQVQGGHGVIPVDVVDPPVHVSGEGRALLAVLGDEHAAVRPVESSQPDDGASRGQNRLFRLNEEAAFSGGGVDVMFLRDPASVRDAIDGGAGAEDDRRSGEGFQRVLRSADVEAAVGFL